MKRANAAVPGLAMAMVAGLLALGAATDARASDRSECRHARKLMTVDAWSAYLGDHPYGQCADEAAGEIVVLAVGGAVRSMGTDPSAIVSGLQTLASSGAYGSLGSLYGSGSGSTGYGYGYGSDPSSSDLYATADSSGLLGVLGSTDGVDGGVEGGTIGGLIGSSSGDAYGYGGLGATGYGLGGYGDGDESYDATMYAHVDLSPSEVSGSWSASRFDTLLAPAQDASLACYRSALKTDASLMGQLTWRFTVGSDGKLGDVVVEGTLSGTSADVGLKNCATIELKKVTFTAADAGKYAYTANYQPY